MEKEMLGYLFRYEDGMLFKKSVRNNNKWLCCNDLKPVNTGYIHVKVNGKMLKLHRLVYLFHNPDWDIRDSCQDNSIDHINLNKLDNRIENLRVVNNSQNMQNTTHWGGKPIRGVSFHKQRNEWQAQWQENGKRRGKTFKTESEALEHRAKMIELHYTHHPSKRPDQTFTPSL
jgi:hypothetical protein